MLNTGVFAGKTIFISGGSRGIGKAIAVKLAKDGANVAIAAKTVDIHPKLEGTIYSAAEEVEKAGGKCLPIQCDLRDEEAVKNALEKTVNHFGGLDVLVNNASAISLTGTEETTMKKYDLMHTINTRGTFMCSKYAIPHLKKALNPHILNLSPPLVMTPKWFKNHVAYTMAKYGMSMCVLGMSHELKDVGIAVNALWPRTAIWTAAMAMLGGTNEEMANKCRKVDILSDSAYGILSKNSKQFTGNFVIDEDFLLSEGIQDLNQYAVKPGHTLMLDFFLPESQSNKGDNVVDMYADVNSNETQSSGVSSDGKIDKIFAGIKASISDDLKKDINACLAFVISGQNWLIDANSSRPLKVEKTETTSADVTLITDDETFEKMVRGELKPTNAFMAGKLKIKGNISVAMKAEKLFSSFKSKL
ncbi:hydroxysteroid dehydrogenase-like protein 2 [Oppia nitens]|uniref:hydroxysteroid dehydrogenase-like protein 2 n=1 Tax=Oppia nitens TaxID=1686743 RepID=UPI0023DAB193|nr:hydroxysteroid dehydrogenase-like protein 2 [Oppia nitens]